MQPWNLKKKPKKYKSELGKSTHWGDKKLYSNKQKDKVCKKALWNNCGKDMQQKDKQNAKHICNAA